MRDLVWKMLNVLTAYSAFGKTICKQVKQGGWGCLLPYSGHIPETP